MDGFFLGGPPPPEIVAELERRRDLHNMAQEDSQRMFEEFVESLSEEQLQALKGVVGACIEDQNPSSYAIHTLGWINSRLKYRFNVCLACGQKHEEIPTTEGEPGEQSQS